MRRALGVLVFIVLSIGQAQARGSDQAWIAVDTQQQTLSIMQGGQVQKVFAGVSVGYGGAADLRFRGDGQTPKGTFQVGWINRNSKFHLFFGLDYPNLDHAWRAYLDSKIDFDTFLEIRQALSQGHTPPQDTALGGYIGIHGLGNKDPKVHKTLNWTEGCVALTDEQVEQLARWVDVGTQVVIF